MISLESEEGWGLAMCGLNVTTNPLRGNPRYNGMLLIVDAVHMTTQSITNAMTRPIITLTTDFGTGSVYVSEMKGVALSLCPEAVLIDISHDVTPQNVRTGALYLAQAAQRFPPS
jgi:hypothetical protein